MSNKKIRVALVGAGFMANRYHYPCLASFEDVELVGICDLDNTRASETAQRFGIPEVFSDCSRMLQSVTPDAVYALMQPPALFCVAMTILEAGCHLFVEKPPGMSTFQARSLAHMAAKNNLITGVAVNRRYSPVLNETLQTVRQTGEVHQVVVRFDKNMPPEDYVPYGGGALDLLRYDGVHAVDMMRYSAGLSEVTAVTSEVRNLDCNYPMSWNCIVQFANGVVGIGLMNRRVVDSNFTLDVHAYDISAHVECNKCHTTIRQNGEEDRELAPAVPDMNDNLEPKHFKNGWLGENRAFIDAVKTGKELHNNLSDSVKTMELCDLIYQNSIN